MAEPLLTKDSINIAGHKFPIALIGGIAAVVGVLLVLQARKSGAGASIGAVPGANTGVNPAFGSGSFAPDYSGALANIQQEITSLQQGGINSPTSGPSASPPSQLVSPPKITIGNPFGRDQGRLAGLVPLYTEAGIGSGFDTIGTLLQPGQQITDLGPGIYNQQLRQLFYPVSYGGQTYYLAGANALNTPALT